MGKSNLYEMDLVLGKSYSSFSRHQASQSDPGCLCLCVSYCADINCEIYNIKQGEQIAVMISRCVLLPFLLRYCMLCDANKVLACCSSPYADGRGDPKDYTHDMGVRDHGSIRI